MRSYLIRLGLLIVVMGFVAGGCGTTRDSGAEKGGDNPPKADTANIDASAASAEALPTIDSADDKPGKGAAETASSAPPAEGTAAPAKAPEGGDTAASAPAPVAGTGQIAAYSVQKGDTLMKIAFNLYGDIDRWKSVYDLNKETLTNPNQLTAGMSLKYDKPASEPAIAKNGDPYLIKKGDTLGTIADDIYAKKSKWKKLYENNRGMIKDPNRIYAGFYLYYQLTEQEKQEAEAIKAKRGGQQLGTAGKLPDSAAAGVRPGAGGLESLAAPPPGRFPAAAMPKKGR